MVTLGDLRGKTEHEIKEHLAYQYGVSWDTLDEIIVERLKNLNILIAYESVGDWGCDSSSYFLLKDKISDELFEIHGSHCSCYGFEDQFDLEPMTLEAIKLRSYLFSTGGYDTESKENIDEAMEFINSMS
jgi:hypothetical protein